MIYEVFDVTFYFKSGREIIFPLTLRSEQDWIDKKARAYFGVLGKKMLVRHSELDAHICSKEYYVEVEDSITPGGSIAEQIAVRVPKEAYEQQESEIKKQQEVPC